MMNGSKPRNILVLGSRNSTRSIMTEAYINAVANGRWVAYSAGSAPTEAVNSLALTVLAGAGIRPADAKTRSWNDFAMSNSPELDFVISVCDIAASESSPLWPGNPRTLHWPLPDPVVSGGSLEDRIATFQAVFDLIRSQVDAFMEHETSAARRN